MSLLVALDDVRFVAKFKIAYFFFPSFLHEWNVLHVLCVIWKTVFHLEENVRFCFFENWTLSVEIALGFDHCGILRPKWHISELTGAQARRLCDLFGGS